MTTDLGFGVDPIVNTINSVTNEHQQEGGRPAPACSIQQKR